jgi:hypothetical protein
MLADHCFKYIPAKNVWNDVGDFPFPLNEVSSTVKTDPDTFFALRKTWLGSRFYDSKGVYKEVIGVIDPVFMNTSSLFGTVAGFNATHFLFTGNASFLGNTSGGGTYEWKLTLSVERTSGVLSQLHSAHDSGSECGRSDVIIAS